MEEKQVMPSPTELRLQNRMERREVVQSQHEVLLVDLGDKEMSDIDREQIKRMKAELSSLDEEITGLIEAAESQKAAEEQSKSVRRALTGGPNVEIDQDGLVYRDFYTYARDYVLTRGLQNTDKLAKQFTRGDTELGAMQERLSLLKRVNNTLSSNVGGLTPAQHIAQIFQVINNSRPLVASALRSTLDRGTLTYPSVDTRPVVAVQTSEKTEAGNTGMVVSLATKSASTYLGGGDLSWQAINWSTPDALQLWFDLAAADYALKTEQDASQVMQHSAFTHKISTLLSSTPTFAEVMTAIGAGYAKVYADSGRIANTLYVAPDRYGYILGLTSNAFAQFVSNVSTSQVGPLNVVVARGMDSGVAAVGDSQGLLVAETAGAPVELRVVEPAIGGVEVGIIGAFAAVVVDPGAFSMITTAS